MTTILAMTSYFKGEEFLREVRRQDARVILLTVESLANDPWPRESIDDVFLMPSLSRLPDVVYAVAYLARSQPIDRIVPLDEYDVEMAAVLREHLRIPGMGHTLTRQFRDKLTMREIAHRAGIREAAFTPVINYDDIRDYMERVPPPWVLKPRLEAGAMGIRRVYSSDELWGLLDQLGDQMSFRVLEQYIPGDVYHVDALTVHGEVIFNKVSRYGRPPLNVSHDGGVFATYTLTEDDPDAQALVALNRKVIAALDMQEGPTHAEYIRGAEDGEFYFLEIAARVGGAHIADLVAAASGVNLWAEWARLEIAHARSDDYTLPPVAQKHGGLLVSLARQETPDLSGFDDPEVVWRLEKAQHAGVIVASEDYSRVQSLLGSYQERFERDFLAVAPPKETSGY